jgi:pyrrolidone-carboxylate peptidase
LSKDCGLFVCNYTFYSSLRQCSLHAKGRPSTWYSLFVHVPPFSIISADKQIRFAANLLDVIAATMSHQRSILLGPQTEMLQAYAQ